MDSIKGRILLIDDDPLVLMNHADIVQDAGYDVQTADSCGAAWSILEHSSFDLIVCDHDLTDGKGIDLLKKLINAGKKFPVIYLSAAQAGVFEEVSKLETVKKVIAKPVNAPDLVEAVDNFKSAAPPDTSNSGRFIGLEERKLLLDNPLLNQELP